MVGKTGGGLMTAGVDHVVRYVFDELGLHRLEANIQPGNTKPIALVRRVDFVKEGFSPPVSPNQWCLARPREMGTSVSGTPQSGPITLTRSRYLRSGTCRRWPIAAGPPPGLICGKRTWGSSSSKPKVHFRPFLLHKGLDFENGVVPEALTNPNGAVKTSLAVVPLRAIPTGL